MVIRFGESCMIYVEHNKAALWFFPLLLTVCEFGKQQCSE